MAPPGGQFETVNMRPMVSRFGGMVMESHAVHIPAQPSSVSVGAADNDNDFESRSKPAVANAYVGIPGYTGFKPHGSHPAVLGVNRAPDARDPSLARLDTSKQPYIMPVVGFTGHIRGLADAPDNYGTSHWKNSGAVTTNIPAASRPYDGRDIAGRPFGGQAPGDQGRYEDDPEFEEKKREAEEANEILELRSMGIRAKMTNPAGFGANPAGFGATPWQPSRAQGGSVGRADDQRLNRIQQLEKNLGVDKVVLNSMGLSGDTSTKQFDYRTEHDAIRMRPSGK